MFIDLHTTSKTRIKVLHIITGLNDGGAEAVLFRLIVGDTGNDHHVISLMGPGKYGPLLEQAGVTVKCLHISSNVPSLTKFLRLMKLIREARPDVVQTWMYHADLLGGLAAWITGNRRVVWGLHSTTLSKQETKRATRVVVKFNAKLARIVPKFIISCSRKGIIVHREAGYPADKLVVAHNGYDVGAFRPNPEARARIREEFGFHNSALLIGCVARFDPQKDHANLAAAFKIVQKTIPSARLILVGSGMDEKNKELSLLIQKANISNQITLCGARSDISSIMNALDIHVLGSSFGEAFPNVLNEAMACGTPCVATDVGDSALIIGGTGEICVPSDSAALALSIQDMIIRLDEKGLSEACRQQIVDNFSLDSMIRSYTQIWAATG